MKSKNLIVLVSLLFVLLALVSCNTSGSTDDTTEQSTQGNVEDTPVTTENIIEGSTTQYKIVRPDLTSEELQYATVKLRNEINTHYGTSVQIETDFEGRNFDVEKRYKYEIVVGSTNRS